MGPKKQCLRPGFALVPGAFRAGYKTKKLRQKSRDQGKQCYRHGIALETGALERGLTVLRKSGMQHCRKPLPHFIIFEQNKLV